MSDFTQLRKRGKAHNGKPHPDFPLWVHQGAGRWCKKLRGRFHYFPRVADDPDGKAALEEWLRVKDALLAGRERPINSEAGNGLTVRDLSNHWLTHKKNLLECGELAQRTFDGYYASAGFLIGQFGKHRSVDRTPWLWFYDAKSKAIRKSEWDVRVAKGTYYAGITSRNDRLISKPFEVTFLFSTETDASEPNDTFETARVAKFGTPLLMNFIPRGDRDTLSFDIDKPGIVNWKIENWQLPARPIVKLFDAEERLITENRRDARVGRGRIYAQIGANYEANQIEAAKRLAIFSLDMASDPDPHEPANDDATAATNIQIGKPFKVWLAPSNDIDHVRLKVDRGRRFEIVRTSGPESVQLKTAILTKTGRHVDWVGSNGKFNIPTAGEIYSEIHRQSSPRRRFRACRALDWASETQISTMDLQSGEIK